MLKMYGEVRQQSSLIGADDLRHSPAAHCSGQPRHAVTLTSSRFENDLYLLSTHVIIVYIAYMYTCLSLMKSLL